MMMKNRDENLRKIELYVLAIIREAGFDESRFTVEVVMPRSMEAEHQAIAYRVWSGVFVMDRVMYLPSWPLDEGAMPYVEAHLAGAVAHALKGWTRNHAHYDKVRV